MSNGLVAILIVIVVLTLLILGILTLILGPKRSAGIASLTAFQDFLPKDKQRAMEIVIEQKDPKKMEEEESGETTTNNKEKVMNEDKKSWKTYEEIAQYLLNRMAEKFDLNRVERKQKVSGQRSGTEYEIEAKGVGKNGEGFVIIECRRYTTSKLKQEHLSALAYRIIDTGAEGGIIVTPIGLQDGAAKIAKAENVKVVHLSENSSRENYMLRFLNQVFIGITDKITITDSLVVKIVKTQ